MTEPNPLLAVLRQIRDKLGQVAPADFKAKSDEAQRRVEAAYYIADNTIIAAEKEAATPEPRDG